MVKLVIYYVMIRKSSEQKMTRSAVILSERAKQSTFKMDDEDENKNCFFLNIQTGENKNDYTIYLCTPLSFNVWHSNWSNCSDQWVVKWVSMLIVSNGGWVSGMCQTNPMCMWLKFNRKLLLNNLAWCKTLAIILRFYRRILVLLTFNILTKNLEIKQFSL